MKTKFLIIFALSVTLVIPFADGVPHLNRERSYEKADFVFYGEVLSLDILSESIQTHSAWHGPLSRHNGACCYNAI